LNVVRNHRKSVGKVKPLRWLMLVLVILEGLGWAQSLRVEGDRVGLLVGAGVEPFESWEGAYIKILAREFSMVEPGDAMKWWVIRRQESGFDFSRADPVVEFAHKHGMKVRGHTLVWGRQNPEWLSKGRFAPPELSRLLKQHIDTVVSHYRSRVFAWDVVNEALDEKGTLRSTLWYDQPGIGLAGKGSAYMEQAFRWAHEADPDALLFYNDSGGEAMNAKSDAIYAMVKDFKARGVPIHGVGLQMHVDLHADVAGIAANIRRLTALGVEVHVTEMDVALRVGADEQPVEAGDLERQAAVYGEVARACLANPGCTAIQTWGFTDKHSWIRSHSHGTQGAALLFDAKYAPKPAYGALKEALAEGRGGSIGRQHVEAH
jgi:endo-1,4-beta-xylanase